MRRPGIEPGTTAWKAAMLTITPSTLDVGKREIGVLVRSYNILHRTLKMRQ